ASVIRMLSSYIGLETFLKGIRQYLAKHQYRNAATTDLWAALSEASGRDIGEFMAQWTLRVGYPVLTVTEEAVGGEGSDEVKVHVRQNRFLVSGTVTSEEDQNVWWVPLNFATNDPDFEAKSGSAVLTEREASFSLPKGVAGDNGWYKLNKDTVSLFRVQYSDVAIKRLAKAIENKALSTNDRIGIFSDLSALAESGLGKTSAMLTLIKSNADECQDEVWGTIQESLGRLTRAWIDQPSEIYDKIQALKRELFGPLVRRLGYEVKRDEDNKITRLRSRAIISAGIAGDKEIIGKVREWLDSVSAGTKPSPVHADLLEPMFIVAVNQGGEREYEVVKTYYLDEKNPIDQRLVALQALGATKVPSLMDATLKFLLSDAVRNQDIHTGIARLTMTPEGRDKLWDWFKASYDNFLKRYGDSMSYMSVLVRYTMMGFSSEEKASEVEQFFADKDVSRIDRALNQSLETIRTYAKWVERDSEDVK
ncbi:Aminopeptidase 2 mitochondrial, partial [Spiromyces aspiralis]